MVFIYLILFCGISAVALFDKNKDKYVTYIYVGIIALLTLVAGFRPYDGDRDIATYLAYYANPGIVTVEYTFVLLANFAKDVFNTPRALFVAYALLSVPLKGYALTRLSKLWFVSLLMWLSHYFMLHEMTQIRVAVSISIFLFALPTLLRGQRLKYIVYVLVAAAFHLSALALLPLVFLGNKELGRYWKIVLYAVPFVCLVMYGLKLDMLSMLPIPYVQERIKGYEYMRDQGLMGDEAMSFTLLYFVKIAAYFLFLLKYDVLKEHVTSIPLLLKIYALSFLSYSLFAFLPVLAWRMRELYGVVEIVLIPYLVYTVKPVNVGKILVIVFAAMLCLTDLFVNRLIG